MTRHLFLILSAFLVLGCSLGGGGGKTAPRIDHTRATTFENDVLTIDYTHRDGARVVLDTQRDAESTAPFATEMPAHAGRAWTLLQKGEDGKDPILGYVVVSWNEDDPEDYLAAGWWIRFINQRYPDIDPKHDDSQTVLFIDGPELDPNFQPPLPATGTASYSGGAGGRYLYTYGDGWGDAKGKISSEDFAGVATFTADFAAGTIEGCLGCEGDLTVQRLHLASAFNRFETEPVALLAHPRDYEVRFAPTEFNPDGTFQTGEGVTVTHPGRSVDRIRTGYWGGGLSNRRDGAGNPRLVAGFNKVTFIEQDGSESTITAIFNALSHEFRAEGPASAQREPAPPRPGRARRRRFGGLT